MIREQIEDKLRAAFEPLFLEVVDESYRHNVPAAPKVTLKWCWSAIALPENVFLTVTA